MSSPNPAGEVAGADAAGDRAVADLGGIVAALGGELIGDASLAITRLGPLNDASATTLAFVADARHAVHLTGSQAACVIVAPVLRDAALSRGAAIVTADPYLYWARLTQWWVARMRSAPPRGAHPTAVIEPGAAVDPTAHVGAFALVEAGAGIAAGAVIGAHCVIGAGAWVGAGTRFAPHVTFGAGCRIGERGVVHGGAVIGADGFGFAPHDGAWMKIEQLGAVVIGDDVEIGANTCIDRGALGDTVVEDGVKLDNLIQIGHNVRIGAHTAIAACAGIAGSTRIGARCTIGGAAGIVGHIEVADGVHIGGACVVTRSILKPGAYGGVFPFDDNGVWEKNAATLRQLHALRARVRDLEKKTS